MKAYYDTGILLKLYVEEPESEACRKFVTRRKEPLFLSSLHLSECTSALRLKDFRGECGAGQVSEVLSHIAQDFQCGVLKTLPVDWEKAWAQCRALTEAHAAAIGCRTLDTLHVACATLAFATEFVTSDGRQAALAKLSGLKVVTPLDEPIL